jgi:hypothetical protein
MNYRSDRDANLEIDLDDVCIASRNFKVQTLEGQMYSHHKPKAPSLQIGWQERVTLHYLVIPIEKTTCFSTLSVLSSLSTDNIACDEALKSFDSKHLTDFMCRERAHEVFTVCSLC